MRDEAGTRLHLKIKGNRAARKKMIKLIDVLEREGVELRIEISNSISSAQKKNRTGSER